MSSLISSAILAPSSTSNHLEMLQSSSVSREVQGSGEAWGDKTTCNVSGPRTNATLQGNEPQAVSKASEGERNDIPKDLLSPRDLLPSVFWSIQINSLLKTIQVLDVKVFELRGLSEDTILDGGRWQNSFHVGLSE